MKGVVCASAPGSLMVLGEHAVLHGARALVTAVNRRVRVTLTQRADRRIQIVSTLGRCRLSLDRLAAPAALRFVVAALALRRRRLRRGFDLVIRSEFSHRVGLGSSAAVTVATLAAVDALLGRPANPRALFLDARRVIRRVQGVGSGADAAASVYGGLVAYRARPLSLQRLAGACPLTVIYSGSKRPTADVIRFVEARRRRQPKLFKGLFRLMDRSTTCAVSAVRRRDWATLGALLNLNQGLMAAMGVSNARLAAIVYALRVDPGIRGAKISGSGLGDCVIGLGRARGRIGRYVHLPVAIEPHGVRLERTRR